MYAQDEEFAVRRCGMKGLILRLHAKYCGPLTLPIAGALYVLTLIWQGLYAFGVW